MRRRFVLGSFLIIALLLYGGYYYNWIYWLFIIFGPILTLGFFDYFQTTHSVLRNWPFLGHFRYWLEAIRPEISQYFIETDTSGRPFSRDQRTVVYTRAKKVRDTVPFGTLMDVYETGYEWVNHSIAPIHLEAKDLRITVGGPHCKQPYNASRLNISAMSFGSLSNNAIEALNRGAKAGNFAHNTGEGGISPYHLKHGGDLIWQIGTGYFGCRTEHGTFNAEAFKEKANFDNVKMIEIKLSQGAKPGHGGILPAAKLTPEIADIRGVPLGRDVLSPPYHSAFQTPLQLMQFINHLRELSNGKPIGFKLCVGKRREFLAICKAMIQTGIKPDFITVDGGEGGTGAAPLEFTNHMGAPLMESLIFVDNALRGFDLRKDIRVISSGKVMTGFSMIKRFALGADMLNSARAMMMALGCIQALRCNSNECPVGVATQNKQLTAGLVVEDKYKKVANYHSESLRAVSEMMGAMGLDNPDKLKPWHILRRTSPVDVKHYGDIYQRLKTGDLLKAPYPPEFERAMQVAQAESFESLYDRHAV